MSTSIIPIKFNVSHSKRIEMTPDEIEELSFSDIPLQSDGTSLRITEADVEEFVRRNIQVLFPQDETLLIVGRQVVNKEGGRADLVALDDSGYIVLIELKRDASDMSLRKEALEFQAIRYAANYARIKEPQELIQKLFAPYIDKHRDEFGRKELTSDQLASEILKDFLTTNKIKDFNQKQRIVLVSSSFDSQTLSACAWLSKNNIDIRCLLIILKEGSKE